MPSQPEILWAPNPGAQTRFLASRADECLYGGAAGGGKSAASIALPLRWIEHPRFRCLFLRRESKYLKDAIDKSDALYPKLGAVRNQTSNTWRFPSGAEVWLNHCEHERDIANYDSLEFHLVIFEELTHFTEKQYVGIKGRIRGTDPALPRQVRATCNPGGVGHEWVFARWAPWLDPASPVRAQPGELLHYRGTDLVPAGTPDSLSRTFIPAKLADNPKVTAEYKANLMQFDPVRRAQLLEGDWLKKPAPRDYWDRARITAVDATPADVVARVRWWDLAGSTRKKSPYTAGAKLARLRSGVLVLEHMVRFRGEPDAVHKEFTRVAEADALDDPAIVQGLPQDPGQAGKDQVRTFQLANSKVRIRSRPPTGDKLTRFGLASSRALNGTLVVVKGSWNATLHDELEAIPENEYWDQADALSDAVGFLAAPPARDGTGGWTQPTLARPDEDDE